MPYGETKVYFDGSHYIAIPHTETPRKRGRYKGPPKESAPAKQHGLTDRIDVEKVFVECDPAERVFDAKPTEQHELSDRKSDAKPPKQYELPDRKRDAQSPKQYELLDRNGNAIPPEEHELSDRKCSADATKEHELPDRKSDAGSTNEHELPDRVPNDNPPVKEVFNKIYAEHINLPRKERRKQILEEMKPYFEDERTAELFVDANMVRKKNNLIARRIRMLRKVNLQEFNYFVTFTYDSRIHTEDSFRLKLRTCLAHYSHRKGWKYVGVWERSPEKQRLHFHGLFFIPEGTMPGEMKESKSYSFSEHRVQITLQNSYFLERFGINDFTPLVDKVQIGPVLAYLIKYIEKSSEKIVYSRGLPQFFISDILDDDVVCNVGLEDRKLLLFDNFSCFDEGCYVGPVSKETIKHLRKSN